MVNPVLTQQPPTSPKLQQQVPGVETSLPISLEKFILNPLDGIEWVDGKLIKKTGMTFKHSVTQSELSYSWKNYNNTSGLSGKVATEAPCRTNRQVRRPDVVYVTQEILDQYGEFKVLPQSFPLIAEIASPDDKAEELFAKAQEYLASGCQEVWLVFPEAKLVMINNGERWLLFNQNEVVSTQNVLPGFEVVVSDLVD
ncbi:MAG: Uma2 family endonuclease [Symploca sp. SIO2E6]|nr:Uma2 family endonuclease [Symploca sp. SIO2E6]